MKMQKYRFAILVLLIVAAAAALGVLSDTDGHWFGNRTKNALAAVSQVDGSGSILRDGTAYALKADIRLRQDDALATDTGAGCEISFAPDTLTLMDGDSRVEIEDLSRSGSSVRVAEGAVIFETEAGSAGPALTILADGVSLKTAPDSMLSVEAYHGSVTVSVFSGTPSMTIKDHEYALVPGDRVIVLNGEDPPSASFYRVMSSDLRDFLLRRLIDKGGLLFDTEQLENVLENRKAETAEKAVYSEGEGLTCTLEIRCDTVLDHLDMLEPGKAETIPKDGVILPPATASFAEGDTVYDVLRRVCLSTGLELETNYAVTLSGYYLKNLAGLSERECGPQSGWMYKVNGWFPNYGSSRYKVCDGDVIVWCYSCTGLGEDIGAVSWQSSEETTEPEEN